MSRTKVDPAIVQIFAENVRAEIITPKPAAPRLDPAIVRKIADSVKVFNGMPHDILMATLALAEQTPLKADGIVFKEGDIGSSFHVLIAGSVAVEKSRSGTPVQLAKMSAGECFGEMSLVSNQVRSATVRALRDSVTLRFERERLDSYPTGAAIVYRNIARVLSARLNQSSEQLADMVFRSSTF